MDISREVLRASLLEHFKEAGIAPDPKVMSSLLTYVRLKEGESNEANQTRGVDLIEDHHGHLSAKQVNWYNLINVSWYDLLGLGISALPIMMMSPALVYQIAYGCISVIYKFYPKLVHEFKNEDDAKILGAIALLLKEKFTLDEIKASLKKNFDTALTDDYFESAIAFFRKMAILRHRGNGIYQLEEKINYDRA